MADKGGPASHDTRASNALSQPRSEDSSSIARLRALTALTGFWRIPRELQQRILALSCQAPTLPRRTMVGRSFDCSETTLRLMHTSKFFYVFATPLLYKHIRITRPSILVQLQRTLASRPALGQLVRSLHIGADAALSTDWFPMRSLGCGDRSHVSFRLNVGEYIDKWDGHFQEPEVGHSDEQDPAIEALEAAFVSASQCMNVKLGRSALDYSGLGIGSDAWHIRIFEVQAAVELYCFEMRRCVAKAQKKAPLKKKHKTEAPTNPSRPVSYPRLLVYAASRASGRDDAAEKDVFRVSRSQLLARIASPGAPTDSFIHPILFARSNLSWYAQGPDGEIHEGERDEDEANDGAEVIGDVFFKPKGPASDVDATVDPLSLTRISTATVGGNLALARSVAGFTTKLRSLAVTSFFERILAGMQPAGFSMLHSASIGPVPSRWPIPLFLDHSSLRSLKQLSICGIRLVDPDISELNGTSTVLTRLSKLQWSLNREYSLSDPAR